jgi:nicotinamide mononucleotide (NMN) deamidase PncC
MARLEEEVGNLLRKKRLTLGMVESATGGLISHLITNIPGSSDYYKGSITAYSNEVKVKVVGVKAKTISQYGTVSSQVVKEMAERGRKVLAVDICLADTGELLQENRWDYSTLAYPIRRGLMARNMYFGGNESKTNEVLPRPP